MSRATIEAGVEVLQGLRGMASDEELVCAIFDAMSVAESLGGTGGMRPASAAEMEALHATRGVEIEHANAALRSLAGAVSSLSRYVK